MEISSEDLVLESIYRWERERARQLFLTQPLGGGRTRCWEWAEALDEARRVAAYLRQQHWPPGSRIAILSKNCAWWMLSDFAIWMSGHVSVPIYPSLSAQSVRWILLHSDAVACFLGATDENAADAVCSLPQIASISFPTAKVQTERSWDTLLKTNTPLAGYPVRAANELATLIYTSGTTGFPKGVKHRFQALAYNAKVLTSLLRLGSEERILSYLPLAHIVERVGVEACACRMGWRIYFNESPLTFLKDLQRAKPTLFLTVPRLLLKLRQSVYAQFPKERLDQLFAVPAVGSFVKRRILQRLGLECVQYAACGAAPLPVEIFTWFRSLGLNLMEGYGATETMITHLPKPGCLRAGYVGHPLEGVETRLSSEGELLVRSPMHMMGYHKDSKATEEAFAEDGYFRTGDLVSAAEDGQIRIAGRIKEQFKTSKGKYVVPAPIESRIAGHPAVEACCLMGSGQPKPFVVIVLSEKERARCRDPQNRKALEDSLTEWILAVNRDLDPHERIEMLVIADGPWTAGNGLLTPTLKIKRTALEDRYQPLAERWRSLNAPIVWESPLAASPSTGESQWQDSANQPEP